MEMRAREDTVMMARDLTPPITPVSAALHDHSLLSHCSSCFLRLPPADPHAAAAASCCGHLRYCSGECRHADLEIHAASGECRLFRLLLPLSEPHRQDNTAEIRVALRLIHSLEKTGFLPLRSHGSGRIGGLLVGDREMLQEGCDEMAERVREGAILMSRAREQIRRDETVEIDVEEEAVVLRVVMTNAVEVQVGEGRPAGVAVYGPGFSWFNHSCSPNACYRFELAGPQLPRRFDSDFLVSPATSGPEAAAETMTIWTSDGNKLNLELCIYGPRIIVRSIRPLKKDEEVCIAYTDLLQTKASRHSDLWSKYQFVCHCSRCCASPKTYVDHVLCENGSSYNATDFNSNHVSQLEEPWEELANTLEDTINEYLLVENPQACCEKIESILLESFLYSQLQPQLPPCAKFKLQPLHHISLNAYLVLASTYRIHASNLEISGSGEEHVMRAVEMSKAAAAYSLLLAGATNHLFLSEPSLIATASLYWISAGESLLVLLRSSVRISAIRLINESESSSEFHHSQGTTTQRDGSCMSWDEFSATSVSILKCISKITSKVWPFLISGISCLSDIKSPVDFYRLGKKRLSAQVLVGRSDAPGVGPSCVGEVVECSGCKCETKVFQEEEEDLKDLYWLSVHCLIYGGFLATVCYGSKCHSVGRVRNLLSTMRENVANVICCEV